jgi:hypothetical protein
MTSAILNTTASYTAELLNKEIYNKLINKLIGKRSKYRIITNTDSQTVYV